MDVATHLVYPLLRVYRSEKFLRISDETMDTVVRLVGLSILISAGAVITGFLWFVFAQLFQ